MDHKRGSFSGKIGFVLSAAGASVGLGNIWRFPYLAAKYGGAIFLLVYIILAMTFGYTMIIAETSIGRMTGKSPVGAYKSFSDKPALRVGGWINAIIPILIVPYYSVIGGWVIKYLAEYLMGKAHLVAEDGYFSSFISNGVSSELCFLVFTAMTLAIIFAGVENGIERVSKVLMPLLFFMMLILIVRGLMLPGAMKGVEFLFKPDLSAFTGESLLNAMGFAFFSLSVGSGSQMNYGSYLSDRVHLPSSVSWIVFLAILSAILGGLMIMPAVFAFGLSPDAGPGLTFATMPAVFAQLPFGHFFAITFYVCLFVAALTSSISILEMSVQFLHDEFNISRPAGVTITGSILAVLGTLCALSFGTLSHVTIFGKSFFDFFDYLTSNIGMPIGVIGIAIVTAWLAWPTTVNQLSLVKPVSGFFLKSYRVMAGIFAPILILVVMLKGLGVF